jgi:hypothetical protein
MPLGLKILDASWGQQEEPPPGWGFTRFDVALHGGFWYLVHWSDCEHWQCRVALSRVIMNMVHWTESSA